MAKTGSDPKMPPVVEVPASSLVKAKVRPFCNYGGIRAGQIVEVEPKELLIAKSTLMSLEEDEQAQKAAEKKIIPEQDPRFVEGREQSRRLHEMAQEGYVRLLALNELTKEKAVMLSKGLPQTEIDAYVEKKKAEITTTGQFTKD